MRKADMPHPPEICPEAATQLINLCCITGLEHLPKVHNLLVKTPKARECAVVSALFTERALARNSAPVTRAGKAVP